MVDFENSDEEFEQGGEAKAIGFKPVGMIKSEKVAAERAERGKK
jgi:hypothetical protein